MRRYGVLMHITSLPGPYGMGDLGPEAFDFAFLLAQAGARVWQVLPVHPTSTSLGNSPYAGFSAFAGNPLLISPQVLVEDEYLTLEEVDDLFFCGAGHSVVDDARRINFPLCEQLRSRVLDAAFAKAQDSLEDNQDFIHFCEQHDYWLHDYARFITIKRQTHGAPWMNWEPKLKFRDPVTLEKFDQIHGVSLLREKFIQYLFFHQWGRLRAQCDTLGIKLFGDVPIYVTHDSVDVWSHPHYFMLDAALNCTHVAGVPPDYFSATGQRWGNPLYRWNVLEKEGFSWWMQRLEHELLLTPLIRLDHFRGFCGYWEIDADEETAVKGRWRPGPGRRFFQALKKHFGELPFVAEDLGVITADVNKVMQEFNLPGMHVLQFAFSGDLDDNPAVPYKHTPCSVVYTGTHDNPPTKSWALTVPEKDMDQLRHYLGQNVTPDDAPEKLIRMALGSVADLAVVPTQDILSLGEEHRMNTPGVAQGNWGWRMLPDELHKHRFGHIAWLAGIYGRNPDKNLNDEDETVDFYSAATLGA